MNEGWAIHIDGSLRYRGRVVVPQSMDLREEILREFYCSRFAVHPGGTKMYCDLRHQYYWSGMKRHVGDLFDGVSHAIMSRLSRATPAIRDSGVKVGAHHDGLCDSLAMDVAEA